MEFPMKPARGIARFCDAVLKAMPGRPSESPQMNRTKRAPGTGDGIWMAPDFDAPLADFADYR
jgi:hypothetical protein